MGILPMIPPAEVLPGSDINGNVAATRDIGRVVMALVASLLPLSLDPRAELKGGPFSRDADSS